MKTTIAHVYSAYPKTSLAFNEASAEVVPGFAVRSCVDGWIVNTLHAEPRAEQLVGCFDACGCGGGVATPIGVVAVSGGCNSSAQHKQDSAQSVSWWWEL